MNDQQLKQRIAYLVEHGGICDEPLDEIRRSVRVLAYMTATACAMGVFGVIVLARMM